MKVLIVAKTRMGKGACIGGITFEGQSVRLVAADAETNEFAGIEYGVGEVWEVEYTPAHELVRPHVENVIVRKKRQLPHLDKPTQFIHKHMPPHEGGYEVLYEGLAQNTKAGAMFISERTGIPSFSTTFWIPDKALQRDDDAKRIRYRYPTADGGRTLTFVGFQEPLEVIEAGTLLRVSLAHWWRPEERPEGEYRCYVQLSGWFLPHETDFWQSEAPEAEGFMDKVGTGGKPERVTANRTDSTSQPDMEKAYFILESVFGFDEFLPLQEEVIENILRKRDTLAIMPTGGGKSLCYQLPALMFDGLTVVVSPLISLMQDQVDALRELEIPAVFLNSTLTYKQYVATVQQIRQGEVKLLYVAPETLLRPETLVLLDQCQVDCLTIDEAHCISSWGHDFRPEYRRLVEVRNRLPEAVCFAITATATERVRRDIKNSLGFRDSDTYMASFNRENLFLEVVQKTDGFSQVLSFLESHRDESGIISAC